MTAEKQYIGGYKLSPLQEKIWLLQNTHEEIDYFSYSEIKIEMKLDIAKLKYAIKKVIEKFEILRTNYMQVGAISLPFQVIDKSKKNKFEQIDFSNLSKESQEKELDKIRKKINENNFYFEKDFFPSFILIKYSKICYSLLIVAHALTIDREGMLRVIMELQDEYARSDEAIVKDIVQYADASEWMNNFIDNKENGLDFKSNTEKKEISCFKIPFEEENIEEKGGCFKVLVEYAPKDLSNKIIYFCQKEGFSIEHVLLACWGIWLSMQADRNNIEFGLRLNFRDATEDLKGALGLYSYYSPFEFKINSKQSFKDVLKNISTQVSNLLHEEKLYLVTKNLRKNNFQFSYIFDFLSHERNMLDKELKYKSIYVQDRIEYFKLRLSCYSINKEIKLELHGHESYFNHAALSLIIDQYFTWLNALLNNSDHSFKNLFQPNLKEKEIIFGEKHKVYDTKNKPSYCIHSLFEKQVKKHPYNTALITDSHKITYKEVNFEANRLAAFLMDKGIGPEISVGLCADKSIPMIICLMAILKAGGVFVPIDPTYPAERINYIIKDSNLKMLIYDNINVDALVDQVLLYPLSSLKQEALGYSVDSLKNSILPDNLAYIIYTSGSTGKPKGVCVTHSALCRYVFAIDEKLKLKPSSVMTALSTVSADLGHTALFGSLCLGHALYLVPSDIKLDAEKLAQKFEKQPIDCLKIVPSHLDALLEFSENSSLLPTQCLVLGGEAPTKNLVQKIRSLNSFCRIINHYGPTETTIGSLCSEINNTLDRISIGTALPGYQAYILNKNLELVPLGIKGEIYIGGGSIARGYLGKPDLTAEKFIPFPFASEESQGERLYKTGDLGRYLLNGEVECLGRIDHQIKLRGFRIELQEINETIRVLPGVKDVAVIIKKENDQNNNIIAYIKKTLDCDIKDIKNQLKFQLPEYMIPSFIIPLSHIPLTPNGKKDYKLLLTMEIPPCDLEDRIYPRNDIEKKLHSYWVQVLKNDQISVTDDFFEMGGHSLLATQVIARARDGFDLLLEVRAIFENPTIEKLSLYIEQLLEKPKNFTTTSQIINRLTNREDEIPLSFVQQRLWTLNQLDENNISYNIPAAFSLKGNIDKRALESSLKKIISRHEILRTNYIQKEGKPIQKILDKFEFTLSETHIDESDIKNRITLFANRPFYLDKELLIRATLFKITNENHIFVICLHHIVSDGWSTGIFIKELMQHYKEILGKTHVEFPELPIQYADYSYWQRQRFYKGELEKSLNYWKNELKDIPVILNLPVDRPRGRNLTVEGAVVYFDLSRELYEKINIFCKKQHVTLFMYLLTAYNILLSRYSGQNDILVGTPIANRIRSELENLIGCFMNILVIRCRIFNDTTYKELLQNVKDTTLRAYDNQDAPFEKVVDIAQHDRNLNYSPLFQAMFILQNAPKVDIELPDLELEYIEHDYGVSKFDLTFDMQESNNHLRCRIEYNSSLFDRESILQMAQHYQNILNSIINNYEDKIFALPLMNKKELESVIHKLNYNYNSYSENFYVHELIEQQIKKTPKEKIICGKDCLTYDEFWHKVNKIMSYLQGRGVSRDVLVAIYMDRSIDMLLAMVATIKAGGAYVPIDPMQPLSRVNSILESANIKLVFADSHLKYDLEIDHNNILNVPEIIANVNFQINNDNNLNENKKDNSSLAYVIYTSGSTGKPKGVMVEHKQIVNFFNAMDNLLGKKPGVWLAITSISFDISVLELLWTLSNGYKLIIAKPVITPKNKTQFSTKSSKKIDFSLFYFASDEKKNTKNKYNLLIEGAKYADKHDFKAVWTPERHFGTFGGLYPNSAITSAAIATITDQIQIRSGSCVLPLHNPIRVAEDWSVIDNLSNGRVGLSFATGWQPDDFVLAPNAFDDRKQVLYSHLETIKRLWAGDGINLLNGKTEEVLVKILPQPIQSELPIWLTAAGNPETFRKAGEIGANILTHLLGQTVEELQEKIKIYREAWRLARHQGEGIVSLMLHTFVSYSEENVLKYVKEPFKQYLKESLDLSKVLAKEIGLQDISENYTEEDLQALLEYAFKRYYSTSGLFGTPKSCLLMVDSLKKIDINEIACLIDFGLPCNIVLDNLCYLNQLRELSNLQSKEEENYESIPDQIKHYGVTHLQCTPSLARTFFSEKNELLRKKMYSLNTLLVGGEKLNSELAINLKILFNGKLYNMYGPTETTIWSTYYEVNGGEKNVPIGRPLHNSKVYIVDQNNNHVPIGVYGELVISGGSVSRGYVNQEQFTQKCFIDNPFCDLNKIIYKTGDFVRLLRNGNIEYLIRKDNQVKIRGYRVELEEIESVLLKHSLIKEVKVIIKDNEDDEEHQDLIAYLTLLHEQEIVEEELREYLASRLPDYMIPSCFLILEKMPLTVNGKIDANNLPSISSKRKKRKLMPPTNDIEKALINIWKELLGVSEIGIDDNFFELGGDSIISIQLVAKANSHGFRIFPRQVFENQTIASLAKVAEFSSIVEVRQEIITGEIPLSPIQHWFFEQKLADPHHYNQAIMLKINQTISLDHLKLIMEKLLSHHDMLRLKVHEENGIFKILLVESINIPIDFIDLSSETPEKMRKTLKKISEEKQQEIDLANGPSLKIVYFLTGEEDNYLLIIVHHLAIDGVSWRILADDMEVIQKQLSVGQEIKLPAKTTSFKDWSLRLHEYSFSEILMKELTFWEKMMHNSFYKLSVDVKDGMNLEKYAKDFVIEFNEERTMSLLKDVNRAFNTEINDILLCALLIAFSKWTLKNTLWIDLESHGRNDIFPDVNLSRTVGWFTTIHPICLNLVTDDLKDSIRNVKEQLRSIPEHGLGFGVLNYLSHDKQVQAVMSQFKQPEIIFNYLGQLDRGLEKNSFFQMIDSNISSPHGLNQERKYLLNINGSIFDQRLKIIFTYSDKIYHEISIKKLADLYYEALEKIIDYCSSGNYFGFSPSDFPDVNLDQAELDTVLEEIQSISN